MLPWELVEIAYKKEYVVKSAQSNTVAVPRIGMFATVRNRRGIIIGVDPYEGLNLVHIEYKDEFFPRDERLVWELEPANIPA